MTIKLPSPVSVETKNQYGAEVPVSVSSLSIRVANDSPIDKIVSVSFYEGRYPLVVWSGADYDAVGQWTQDQLEAAVTAKVNADPAGVVNQILNTYPAPSKEDILARAKTIRSQFPNGIPRPAFFV